MKIKKLEGAIKDYIWGGRKLIAEFGKKTELSCAAECWALSAHPDGESIVLGDNITLPEYIKKNGKAILGKNAQKFDFFPILIKLIDAKENLSIQVHPSDEYALRVEGEYGKTEMWYIADCDEGAYLYYGFNRDMTREEVEKRIKNNTILEVLNKVLVKRGDVFFIEAGTLHAIGGGNVICEIQQNSNTTYRVYDYDRRGKDGKPRELHVKKALDVMNYKKASEIKKPEGNLLAKCKYFTVYKHDIDGKKSFSATLDSFNSVIVLDGEGIVKEGGKQLEIKKGDSLFVPSGTEYEIEGKCEIILSMV